MDIPNWIPYITVVGVGLTLIQTLWMVFMGPATIPEKWQIWQNKIGAHPRLMLSILFLLNVLLICYIIGYLWYLSGVVINLPPFNTDEGESWVVGWPLDLALLIITAVGLIWLIYFAVRIVRQLTQNTRHTLKVVFRVNVLLVVIAYTVVWVGGWYISTHPQDLNVAALDLSKFKRTYPIVQKNMPLSCNCPSPVVSATLVSVAITSSQEATVTIKFTNPNAQDINLSFEYVTLQDPQDGNKIYKGDYDSFVVPANGLAMVPVIFHINTSQKKMYIFSMSLVKGSYWKHQYRDVTISF